MYGHTSFIYTLGILPSGEILSGGEDHSVRIWKGAEQIQSIIQPCVSVWTVAGSPSGDLIAGGSDGLIRIFTKDPKRRATAEDLQTFADLVSATAIPSS